MYVLFCATIRFIFFFYTVLIYFFFGVSRKIYREKMYDGCVMSINENTYNASQTAFFSSNQSTKGDGCVCVCVRLWVLVLDYLMHYKLIHIFLLVQFVCVCSVCEYVCVVFIKLLTFTFNRNLPAPIFFLSLWIAEATADVGAHRRQNDPSASAYESISIRWTGHILSSYID